MCNFVKIADIMNIDMRFIIQFSLEYKNQLMKNRNNFLIKSLGPRY